MIACNILFLAIISASPLLVVVSTSLPVFLCLCSVVVFLPQCLCSWTCVCVGANSGCVSIAVFVLVFLLPVKVM